MRRHLRSSCTVALLMVFVFANSAYTRAQDPEQYLRDHYTGKTFVLRGFYSASHLRYDSSGTPDKPDAGDWTEDGFVLIQEIHASNDRLRIKCERLVAEFSQKQFQLRPAEEQQPGKERKAVFLKIEADFPQHNPSPQQVDELMSRIFFTAQDQIADAVPAYWKPCVRRGVLGEDTDCVFSPEILTAPGVAGTRQADPEKSAASEDTLSPEGGRLFHPGKDVLPPKIHYQREPEFSESARAAKYQGTAVLMLVVDKEGLPRNVRVVHPLGHGLDAKAVEAVESWKFEPARKDGEPVAVEIAVEVDFHLY